MIEGRKSPAGHHGVRLTLSAVAGFVFSQLSRNLGTNDLLAGDEGYYGVMARNILHGPAWLLNPSLSPLGPPGDKPFLFPLYLAGAVAAGGPGAISLRLASLAAALLSAFFLTRIGAALGYAEAGLWGALLYLTSSFLGSTGRVVFAENLLTPLSLAGLWMLLEAMACREEKSRPREGRPGRALLGGTLFGLAFLCKMWLCLPAMFGALGALAALHVGTRGTGTPETDAAQRRGRIQAAALAGAAFVAVASLQITLCALFAPGSVRHWSEVIFGFSLLGRVGGMGFAGYWRQPWSYYLDLLGHMTSLWMPLVCLGATALIASAAHSGPRRAQARTAAAVLALWILWLIPLSVAAVKAGNYIIPILPAFFLLAGFGLASLRETLDGRECAGPDGSRKPPAADDSRERAPTDRPRTRPFLIAGALALALTALELFCGARGSGGRTAYMVVPGVRACWALLLLAIPLALGRRASPRGHPLLRVAAGGILLVTLLGGLAYDHRIVRERTHVTGYARLAERLAPGLAGIDPRQTCFYAPEWPTLSFHTFRTGRYWESPYVPADPAGVGAALHAGEPFFFVVGTGSNRLYGGLPDGETRARIQAEAHRLPMPAGDAELEVYCNDALWTRLGKPDPSSP